MSHENMSHENMSHEKKSYENMSYENRFYEKMSYVQPHCTVSNGADITPEREVFERTNSYGSASRSKVSFTPAHVF